MQCFSPFGLVFLLSMSCGMMLFESSFPMTILFTSFFLCVFIFGSAILLFFKRDLSNTSSFFLPLILGYISVSCIGYLSLFLFNLVGLLIVTVIISNLALIFLIKNRSRHILFCSVKRDEIASIIFCFASSLLWSQECFSPWRSADGGAIYLPWMDSFHHASWISSLSHSFTIGYIQDIRVAGVSGYFYHAAQYFVPGIFSFISSISTLDFYLKFLTPICFFCVGGAAFCLTSYISSQRAGLFSVLLVLGFPTTTFLGVPFDWFNFHWLLSISPSLGFGIAHLAIGIIFILEAIREKKLHYVLFAIVFSLLSILSKFQLLVPMFPVLIFLPVCMWPVKNALQRSLLFILGTIVSLSFIYSLWLKGIPAFKFQGEAYHWYLSFVISQSQSMFLQTLFSSELMHVITPQAILSFIIIIFLGSFGVLGVIAVILSLYFYSQNRIIPLITLLSVLIYLLHAIAGNRLDPTFGNPEELLHRPVVWSYFLICICIASYISTIKIYKMNYSKFIVGLIAICSLSVPYILGKNTQIGPKFGLSRFLVTTPVLSISKYLANNALPSETLYSLDGDPHYILSGLSGLQLFAHTSGNQSFRSNKVLVERLNVLSSLENNISKDELKSLSTQGLDWLVVTSEYSHLYEKFNDLIVIKDSRYLLMRLKNIS